MAGSQRSYERLIRNAAHLGYPDAPPLQRDPHWEIDAENYILAERDNRHAPIRYVYQREEHKNAYSGQLVYGIFTTIGGVPVVDQNMEDMLDRLLAHARSTLHLHDRDRMQVVFQSNNPYRAASTRFMYSYQITTDMVAAVLEAILQSADELALNQLEIYVKWSKPRAGGVYYENQGCAADVFIKSKTCVVRVTTREGKVDCFPQCMALGLAQLNSVEAYKKLTSPKAIAAREKKAHEIMVQVFGEEYTAHPIALTEIPLFEDRFQVNILIVEYGTFDMVYKGCERYDRYFSFLLIPEDPVGHFHYVNFKKLGSLFARNKFCFVCMRGYQDTRHRCIVTCPGCKQVECSGAGKYYYSFPLVCGGCSRRFFDAECMALHRQFSICEKEKECLLCKMYYTVSKNSEPHYCGRVKCTTCSKHYDVADHHECYMPVVTAVDLVDKNESPLHLYFYDYECLIRDDNVHEMVCVVVIDPEQQVHRFLKEDDFIDYCLAQSNATFLAHNGAKYDMHFIKKVFIARCIKTNDVVNGNTFYSISVRQSKKSKIRFIDSYKFIPFPLRDFPKAFGFTEVTKGHFPYRFLTPARMGYVGLMPSMDWFDFGKLRAKERAEAEAWYREHCNDTINLMDMCVEYCVDDVRVLREGCLRYDALMRELSNDEIQPFRYTTLAGVCMQYYRRFHLPENTIAILPVDDACCENEWFHWLTKTMEPELQRFENYFGFPHVGIAPKKVYVFAKCLSTGCSKCFQKFSVHPQRGKRMYTLQHEWTETCKILKNMTRPYVIMRECEWNALKRAPIYRSVLTEYVDFQRPLSLRAGFYGGRTEVFKPYCKHAYISYMDYRGLYPSTNTCRYRGITPDTYGNIEEFAYPVGHYVRLRGDDILPLHKCFGFIWCRIECPPLHIPFLPERKKGKLVFDNTTKIGVWTSVEIQEAVRLGHKILDIFEVVHFPRRSSTLFREYIDKFVKMKMEATGWSKLRPDCTPEEFVANVQQYMGIHLDLEKVQQQDPNPGAYLIGKLKQNSLWGKFAQRNDQANSVDVYTEKDFAKYGHNDQLEVLDVLFHNGVARTIRYREKRDTAKLSSFTNIAIAAFTTAFARLRLYQALKIAGEDLAYCDTDSLIFKSYPGDCRFQTGPYLGDLANELDEGEYITELVASGPKSYSYVTSKGKKVQKIKGFTLNSETSAIITHDVMKDMVIHNRKRKLETFPLQFEINRSHGIKTRQWDNGGKRFSMDFTKRTIEDKEECEINTRPLS